MDPSYFKDTTEALSSWAVHDRERLSKDLKIPETTKNFLTIFTDFSNHSDFIKFLSAFLKLVTELTDFNKFVGIHLVPAVLNQIETRTEPHSQVSLLKILRALYNNVEDRNLIWQKFNLESKLTTLAESESSVIVNQMAQQMLNDFHSTKKSPDQ